MAMPHHLGCSLGINFWGLKHFPKNSPTKIKQDTQLRIHKGAENIPKAALQNMLYNITKRIKDPINIKQIKPAIRIQQYKPISN